MADASAIVKAGVCPTDKPAYCVDCTGGGFCIAGACPATTCPVVRDAGVDAKPVVIDSGQACPPDPAPPPDLPSTGTVTFVVTNASTADRYIATRGQQCAPFDVAGETILAPFSCGCECAAPQATVTMTRVPAGQSVTLTWDGRHVVSYLTHLDCTAWGAPGQCANVAASSFQPVAPGPLTVTIDYAASVPASVSGTTCQQTADSFTCRGWANTGPQCASFLGAVGGALQATQAFQLPASGNVTVPISLP